MALLRLAAASRVPVLVAGGLGLTGGLFGGGEGAEACGIVGVVGTPKDKEDARGFLLEGLQVRASFIKLSVFHSMKRLRPWKSWRVFATATSLALDKL